MAIRYDKKLSQELARTVRNFNKKVYRLEKLRRELIPERVTVVSLKQEYTSRAELMRRLRELRGFSARGAEDIITTAGGARLTKYEFNILKQRSTLVRRRLTMEIRRMETYKPAVYGMKADRRYAEMGSEELSNLRARREKIGMASTKPIGKLSAKELKKYKKLVYEDYTKFNSMKAWTFRNNYADIIDRVAWMCDVPIEQVQHIKEVLANMPLTEFTQMINIERAFKKILDYYLLQKIQAGVLSYDDIEEVKDTFAELSKNIDKMAAEYNA